MLCIQLDWSELFHQPQPVVYAFCRICSRCSSKSLERNSWRMLWSSSTLGDTAQRKKENEQEQVSFLGCCQYFNGSNCMPSSSVNQKKTLTPDPGTPLTTHDHMTGIYCIVWRQYHMMGDGTQPLHWQCACSGCAEDFKFLAQTVKKN